jgi:hypothetical protein
MSTDTVLRDVSIQAVRNAVVAELRRAVEIHGWFVSKHHALGVLLEEWDELKETITHDESPKRIYEEAIQVSAMAMEIAVMYGPVIVDNPNHTPPPENPTSGSCKGYWGPQSSGGQGEQKRLMQGCPELARRHDKACNVEPIATTRKKVCPNCNNTGVAWEDTPKDPSFFSDGYAR